MNISALFINRPVMTSLVMASLILFGAFAYRHLPVSDLPNVDFPTIQVSASLPGANPDTMASSVATPLEKQFSTIAGIDSMSSVNTLGSTQITLQFALDRNIDAAALDVQAAIGKASRLLPGGMPTPPSYQKVNPADSPIMFMALTSPHLSLSVVNDYAETMISQRLSTINGVAQVQINGAQKFAVRVYVDPRKMASYGLEMNEVAAAIDRNNVNLPTGTLYGPSRNYTLKADGQLTSARQYEELIIAYRGGAPVRVKDIGRAEDSVEDDKTAAWLNNTRGITMQIQRQPGANTVEVVDSIRKVLPSLQQLLPPGMTLSIVNDRSLSIRESVHDVQLTLMFTVLLVIGVIFIFLRNLSATLIPALAVPLSIIGTFAFMHMFRFSIDNLSLMALTLCVGFVVDDAIVMLENIVRRMEHGESPRVAAMNGSKQVGFTIVSMTISLSAVFIPILFMRGILGRLLHEFAVVIMVAILLSGVVSLTLTPMLCSRYLRPHDPAKKHNFLYRAIEWMFNAMLGFYRYTLHLTMKARLLVLLGSFALFYATFHMFVLIPKGFIPNEDIGTIFGTTEAVQGISFEAMKERQQLAAEIAGRHPAVQNVISSIGSSNQGRIFMRLKPRKERAHASIVLGELRKELSGIPGLRVFMQIPPPIRIGGRLTKSQYQLTLLGADTEQLKVAGQQFQEALATLPDLTDVTSDLEIRNPEVHVSIDRDRAATLGVSAEQIESTLYSSFGTRQVSTIYAPTNQYKVILQVDRDFQRDINDMRGIYLRASNGELVPIETLVTLERAVGPLSVNHSGQLTAVTLSFDVKPGVSLGQAVDRVTELAAKTLPAEISMSFVGTAQVFQESLKGLLLLVLMSILVIYIILGILYESYIHPLTILSGLPSAGLGALITLWFFKAELNLYAFVGVIMLVGIVKKNAIMMIDFALEAQKEEGKSPERAIIDGCLVRFRPIMMTTAAALMGTLPIALGYGAGAESRRPLGLAVVGGLFLSQFLTLYITPVYYVYFEELLALLRRVRAWLSRRDKPESSHPVVETTERRPIVSGESAPGLPAMSRTIQPKASPPNT